MSYWGWGYFPRYQTVEERRRKAKKQYEKLLKKGASLDPVTVQGRLIAKSWWGSHWNRNLERYADFHNRLARGRSYVRNGAVLDLKITGGVIQALVAGSGSKPYKVEIKIKPLKLEIQQKLIEQASGQIGTVSKLLEGDFPAELGELFFAENDGLFPKPSEIRFACSCPDHASLCKHVAAVLYGAAARLDARPNLFFTLRGIDMNALLGVVAGQTAQRLLSKAENVAGVSGKRSRILGFDKSGSENLAKMFGISVSEKTSQPVRHSGKMKQKRPGLKKIKKGK